jgi:hypothetical protein
LPGYPADQTYPSPPGYDYPPGPGYPAAPIPGYGPAQAYPGAPAGMYAPPKKRRKWPWIVGGIVVVVIAALVIVGVFFGRTGSGDPRTAVDKFWSALAQHDRGKAEQYVCSNKNLTKSAGFTELINDLNGYTIGPESGSGGTRVFPVTAHVTVAAQNGDITIDTTVKRSAGKWYVCDLANQ